MKIETLSSFPGCPYNDTLETFFDTYTINEDVECYQLLFCPYGSGSSFADLNQINFQSRVVILNIIDLIIDKFDNFAIEELTEFCAKHSEHKFIIFNLHIGLRNQLKIPNLYVDTIIPTNYTEKFKHCEKRDISNHWLSLNADTKLHRLMTVCYLLSKDYYKNGNITFRLDEDILVKHDQYKNITPIPEYLKSNFLKGYKRFKEKDFNLLKIRNFDRSDDRVANNYNQNLLPTYETIGIEIITGTMFFEPTPVLSEKEIQSVYAKNFPIYINGPGIVREFKKIFGVDMFTDVIDHSYDEIEDHFERLAAAFDRNEHLLNGSINISELWNDNRQRFENNSKLMEEIFHDKNKQQMFNHSKIKQGLNYFDISVA